MYAERTPPGDPPCSTCRVDPLEENKDALSVFFEVRYQLIMSMNGPVSINHVAIDNAINRRGIKGRQSCFDKITKTSSKERSSLADWWLERLKEKG